MLEIKSSEYLSSNKTQLADRPTFQNFELEDKTLKKELKRVSKDLAKFQDTMYAHGKYSVLICLQGMDTAGKDSLIREVFKELNARGVVVHSFKVPTSQELKHDYLWRHYIALPERGKFSVFNRTHYENVLVAKVKPEIVLFENNPRITHLNQINDVFWERRYHQINDFEKMQYENGTQIFKFFLHLSKEEQRLRLIRRLNKPEKNWKFSPGDLKERKHWEAYQKAYEQAIQKTTQPHAPWFVIPADNKPAARLIVASILLESLKKLKDVKEPTLSADILANLEAYKHQLKQEVK